MRILIFGGTGSLGGEIAKSATSKGHDVIIATRNLAESKSHIRLTSNLTLEISENTKFDAVIWSQGKNINDAAGTSESLDELWKANIGYIHETFKDLLSRNLLATPARLVIIGSIWQKLARKNKFSYVVTKSAVVGIVNSLTADYADLGITVNAVLPGVVDTPMTRSNLNNNQIKKIISGTPVGRLVSTSEVASVVTWLCSAESSGIVGQCIEVDNGWSNFREI